MAIKSKLKEIRMKEFLMSPGEFAEFLGVDNKIYSSWERERSRPKLEVALKVANKLKRDVKDIWYVVEE